MGTDKDLGIQCSGRAPGTLGGTHHPLPWKGKASTPGCTYKHLDGDRDSAVQRGVASVLGHDRQINQSIGYLFVIQGAAHTDHCNDRNRAPGPL